MSVLCGSVFSEFIICCFLHRRQPSFCCTAAPGSPRSPGVCSSVAGGEAEGCDAVWCCGGVCHLCLRGCPWTAHHETPGEAGTGAESTGELHGERNPIFIALSFILFSYVCLIHMWCSFHCLPPYSQLILELCSSQPDFKLLEPHLKRIHAPSSSTSAPTVVNHIRILKYIVSLLLTL